MRGSSLREKRCCVRRACAGRRAATYPEDAPMADEAAPGGACGRADGDHGARGLADNGGRQDVQARIALRCRAQRARAGDPRGRRARRRGRRQGGAGCQAWRRCWGTSEILPSETVDAFSIMVFQSVASLFAWRMRVNQSFLRHETLVCLRPAVRNAPERADGYSVAAGSLSRESPDSLKSFPSTDMLRRGTPVIPLIRLPVLQATWAGIRLFSRCSISRRLETRS